jgi:hypothetical protein
MCNETQGLFNKAVMRMRIVSNQDHIHVQKREV